MLASSRKKLRTEQSGDRYAVFDSNLKTMDRLESWLLRFWADPQLALCAMELNDIAEAARLSPDFEDGKGESSNNPRNYVSAETMRKIQKRASLTRMHAHLVKNVRTLAKRKKRSSAEKIHTRPCFDYDPAFDLRSCRRGNGTRPKPHPVPETLRPRRTDPTRDLRQDPPPCRIYPGCA